MFVHIRTLTLRHMTTILTVFTHAGGAGKTSIAGNIAHEFAQRGQHVLLIDGDPQSNLTTNMGVQDAELHETLFDVLSGDAPLPAPRHVHGFDLIPAVIDLAEVEPSIPGRVGGILALRDALQKESGRWDTVIIDSPPSLGQLAAACALAADALVVPIMTRSKGLNALRGLNSVMPQYHRLRPDLHVAAYVPTMCKSNRKEDSELLGIVREDLPHVTSPIVERGAVWNGAAEKGLPVTVFAPRSKEAEEIRKITSDLVEFLQRNAPERGER